MRNNNPITVILLLLFFSHLAYSSETLDIDAIFISNETPSIPVTFNTRVSRTKNDVPGEENYFLTLNGKYEGRPGLITVNGAPVTWRKRKEFSVRVPFIPEQELRVLEIKKNGQKRQDILRLVLMSVEQVELKEEEHKEPVLSINEKSEANKKGNLWLGFGGSYSKLSVLDRFNVAAASINSSFSPGLEVNGLYTLSTSWRVGAVFSFSFVNYNAPSDKALNDSNGFIYRVFPYLAFRPYEDKAWVFTGGVGSERVLHPIADSSLALVLHPNRVFFISTGAEYSQPFSSDWAGFFHGNIDLYFSQTTNRLSVRNGYGFTLNTGVQTQIENMPVRFAIVFSRASFNIDFTDQTDFQLGVRARVQLY